MQMMLPFFIRPVDDERFLMEGQERYTGRLLPGSMGDSAKAIRTGRVGHLEPRGDELVFTGEMVVTA